MNASNIPSPSEPHANLTDNVYGLPGSRVLVLLRPRWQGDDSRNSAPPSGSTGWYRVTGVFTRPDQVPLAADQFASSDVQHGTSLLLVLNEDHRNDFEKYALSFTLPGDNGELHCVGYLNPDGCLGKITAHRVWANSITHAEHQFRTTITRTMNLLTLQLDVPLDLASVHVVELSTGTHRIELTVPLNPVPYSPLPENATVPEEFLMYARLYREARNSTSRNYEFLCLYKIIDGLTARRTRLNAIASEVKRAKSRDRIPTDGPAAIAWLQTLYAKRQWRPQEIAAIIIPEVAGKRPGDVTDKILRPLRNRIAHEILTEGELTPTPGDQGPNFDAARLIPIARTLTRHLLRQEFPDDFNPNHTDNASNQLRPREATQPKDDVYESPTISNIKIATSTVITNPSKQKLRQQHEEQPSTTPGTSTHRARRH